MDCKVRIVGSFAPHFTLHHLGRLWLTWRLSAFPLPALEAQQEVNITSLSLSLVVILSAAIDNRLIYITADNEVISVTQSSSDRVLNLSTF